MTTNNPTSPENLYNPPQRAKRSYTPPRRSEPQQRTACKSGLTWAAAGPASRAVWPPPCADG